jgi:hypothetical protein
VVTTLIKNVQVRALGVNIRGMSPYYFEAFAYLEFVVFESWWISLGERSHSSFVLCVSVCVQVSLSLSLLVMPLVAVSGKSRL